MKVTAKTKTKYILPLLNEGNFAKFFEKVPEVPLDTPIEQMSVGQFCEALEQDYALSFLSEKFALKAFGKMKTYRREVERITKYIARFDLPKTTEQTKAAEGINFPSLQERIILDCVKYYHLHSTEEAERLPLSDWLIQLKDNSTSALYNMRYNDILSKKNDKR